MIGRDWFLRAAQQDRLWRDSGFVSGGGHAKNLPCAIVNAGIRQRGIRRLASMRTERDELQFDIGSGDDALRVSVVPPLEKNPCVGTSA
ncbi:hypothetical protein AA103196_0559 [Ameyamaea chiangmaiensis NBRC 103196]|nr:hypothetical protein AA103196_0559 [Ameyamaea chiangmaiensis NBRC 103196]